MSVKQPMSAMQSTDVTRWKNISNGPKMGLLSVNRHWSTDVPQSTDEPGPVNGTCQSCKPSHCNSFIIYIALFRLQLPLVTSSVPIFVCKVNCIYISYGRHSSLYGIPYRCIPRCYRYYRPPSKVFHLYQHCFHYFQAPTVPLTLAVI